MLEFEESPFSAKAREFFKSGVYLGTISNRTGVWCLDDGYLENISSSDYRQIADKLDELNGAWVCKHCGRHEPKQRKQQ